MYRGEFTLTINGTGHKTLGYIQGVYREPYKRKSRFVSREDNFNINSKV